MGNDDEKTVQMDNSNNAENISSTRIKLPQFWTSNPAVWFAQTEAQFAVCSISADSTKFYHVVASLPPEVCESVIEIVTNPPEKNKYAALKSALVSRHALSEERRLEKLLERAELGDRKPSEVWWSMKSLAGNTIDNKLVRTLWLRRMPQVVYVSLTAMGEDKHIDDLLPIADKIYEATTPSVSSVSSPTPTTSQRSAATSSTDLETRLNKIESMLSKMAVERRRSPSRNRNFSYNRRQRSGSRGRLDGQGFCYFHAKFGSNARKCYKPCTFQSTKPVSTPTSKNE